MIELTVLLVLMGIVATLAQPSMSEYLNRRRTQRALDRVTSDLLMARMLAVRSGERAVLELGGPDRYHVRVEGSGDTVRMVALGRDYPGVELIAPTANGQLVYNGRGLLVDVGTGLFVARSGKLSDTLKITAAGRVYRAY